MGIYLVLHRIDGDEEVKLGKGVHNIGYNNTIKCTDPKVPECQISLCIGDDEVTLSSTHENPVFYQCANNTALHLAKKGEQINLNSGDKFALLADQFWYNTEIVEGTLAEETASHQPISNEATTSSNNDSAGSSAESTNKRSNCRYGNECYRKNPAHRAEFAHPGDADYQELPVCPYGKKCYRKNPQHHREYSHPSPKKKKRALKNKQVEYEEIEDDDEEDPFGEIESSDDDFIVPDDEISNSDSEYDDSEEQEESEYESDDSERIEKKKKNTTKKRKRRKST